MDETNTNSTANVPATDVPVEDAVQEDAAPVASPSEEAAA